MKEGYIPQDQRKKILGVKDPHVFLYPTDGYGDINILRSIIDLEKPDALFFITDPRYYKWLFEAENEFRTKIPFIYLNIWDDIPAPRVNPYHCHLQDLFLK